MATVFFGGGTPSAISPASFERIFDALKTSFVFADELEMTVEMNPERVAPELLSVLKRYGVNRLSLGVQSLDTAELGFLGREHDHNQVKNTVSLLYDNGFDRLNFDLIFALPGSTVHSVRRSLDDMMTLSPVHISTYALTIEEGTPFERKRVNKADQDNEYRQYQFIRRYLAANGFIQYEVSAFAKPGHICRHNMNYWRFGDYVGLGPGAFSYFKDRRYTNPRSLQAYLRDPLASAKQALSGPSLDRETTLKEYIIFNLRLINGMLISEVDRRFNMAFMALYSRPVTKLMDLGLLTVKSGRLKATIKGLYVLDEILTEFV